VTGSPYINGILKKYAVNALSAPTAANGIRPAIRKWSGSHISTLECSGSRRPLPQRYRRHSGSFRDPGDGVGPPRVGIVGYRWWYGRDRMGAVQAGATKG